MLREAVGGLTATFVNCIFVPPAVPQSLKMFKRAQYSRPAVPTHRLQPEAIQVRLALLLGQSDEPAAASTVPVVLPHGLNPVLWPKIRK